MVSGHSKKKEKGSAGSHVTGTLCKGTLVSPLHLFQEQRWFPLPTFTASQWTRLVFPLDMTHTVDALLVASLRNKEAQRKTEARAECLERNGSRSTSILNTPCQLCAVKNLHFEFQCAGQDRRIPSYQSERQRC